jgi:hypothetical protein
MSPQVKRLPRLWCAMQGLLPLEACLAAQRGELAWTAEAGALRPEPVVTKSSLPRARDRPWGRTRP